MFDETGIDALRAKSLRLTGYLESLFDEVFPGRPLVQVTPRDPAARGSQLSSASRGGRPRSSRPAAHGARRDRRRPGARHRPVRAGPHVQHVPRLLARRRRAGPRGGTAMTASRPSARPASVAVVGAGLVGCLAACFLARRGYAVTLYERRADPRMTTAERGRSINLALSERGIDALQRLGLADEVMAPALPMHGRMLHAVDGAQSFRPTRPTGSSTSTRSAAPRSTPPCSTPRRRRRGSRCCSSTGSPGWTPRRPS